MSQPADSIPILFVTIGRNLGLEPMSPPKWWAFRGSVRAALGATVGEPSFEIAGPGGRWHGQAESSAVYIVLRPTEGFDRLRRVLINLATDFGQQSIAIATGRSELVGPAGSIE